MIVSRQSPLSTDWPLVAALALLGLVRPLLSILGVYGRVGSPWLSLVVTVIIAAVWIGVVVVWRIPHPFLTLVLAGGLYGAFALVLQQFLARVLSFANAPETLPAFGVVSIIVTNLVWGAVLGAIAAGLRRARDRRPAEVS
jgi:hypothetical protein